MKGVHQFVRILKIQILSDTFNNKSILTPGFPIFLALIILIVMLFPAAKTYLDITRVMIVAYSLLAIGVVWKFIVYIRESRSSRLDEIS